VIHRRRRKLSAVYGLGEGAVEFFYVSRGEAMLRAVEAAKLDCNVPAQRLLRRLFEAYLSRFFAGFELTVPRGRGRDSWMYAQWHTDERFAACFDHLTPLRRRHHWRARLEARGRIEVTAAVSGRSIVLLDDVCTTGTTVATHLVSLLEAGAEATALVLVMR